MPYAKSSKGKRRKKAVLALSAVGALAGSAAANALAPVGDAPSPGSVPADQITLDEEEVWDVSLGTFYVFDKEVRLGKQFARAGYRYRYRWRYYGAGCSCRGCGGCSCRGACGCGCKCTCGGACARY
jgi:hypothetical protein